MKTVKYIIIFVLGVCSFIAKAQTASDQIIIKAIEDELTRSSKEMKIEGYESPYFLSFGVTKNNRLDISASLGAIINSSIYPNSNIATSVKYGSNKLNDENFVSRNQNRSRGYISFPEENDYWAIRRCIWSNIDGIYKNAIMTYKQKVQEIQQQNITELVDDNAEAPVVSYFPKIEQVTYNTKDFESLAKKLSLIFKNYGDIQSSKVEIIGIDGVTYFVNTEGTKTAFPTKSIMVKASCSTLTSDGDELGNSKTFLALSADKLPKYEEMSTAIEKMAKELIDITNATIIDEDYSGPVLFEQSAVSDLVGMRFFSGKSSLIASRTPIYAADMKNTVVETNAFENRLNQKLFPEDVTIKVYSKMKEYNGTQLAGAFDIDNQGVIPADEITLVNGGRVVNLLNGRTPSQKISTSNGYFRQRGNGSAMIAPGTVDFIFANGQTYTDLKKSLLDKAKENGMTYAYIVRKMQSVKDAQNDPFSYMPPEKQNKAFAKLYSLYKVDVNSGAETLVRSGEIKTITESSLKNISGCKDERSVVNTMLGTMPVSYILPNAILFNELDINKSNRSVSTAQPIVSNPLKK